MPRPDPALTRRRGDRLRALSADPQAKAAFAIEILQAGDADMFLTEAASAALAAFPDVPGARDAILLSYERCRANSAKADPGGVSRAALLRALVPLARDEDRPLLLDALHSRIASMQGDTGENLRGAALAALYAIDDQLALLEGALMVGTGDLASGTGEPALTAVRMMAEQERFDLLVTLAVGGLIVNREPGGAIVHAECIRSLGRADPSVVDVIVGLHVDAADPIVAAGVADLLIETGRSADLRTLLVHASEPDLVYYVSAASLASRNETLIALVEEMARLASNPQLRQAYDDALSIRRPR